MHLFKHADVCLSAIKMAKQREKKPSGHTPVENKMKRNKCRKRIRLCASKIDRAPALLYWDGLELLKLSHAS